MSVSKPQPRLYAKLVGAIVSIVVFVLVAELGLGLAGPDLFYNNQFFPLNRDICFPQVYKKDARLFWRFHPGISTESELFSNLSYHVNSRGMRGPEVPDSKSGYRIVTLGNSCTFGWGVGYEDTWVNRLEQILSQELPDRQFEVVNAGIPGYSSHQGKIFFAEEVLNLAPDRLLITFGWNDQFPVGQGITDSEQQMGNPLVLGLQNLFGRLKLYQLLRKALLSMEKQNQARLDDLSIVSRVPRKQFFENLKSIIRTAREHGIEPVLIIPPVASLENYFEGTVSNFHERHAMYQRDIAKVSRYESVPIVDLQVVFDQHDNLFASAQNDPIHFNELGHQVVARTIADHIIPLIASE